MKRRKLNEDPTQQENIKTKKAISIPKIRSSRIKPEAKATQFIIDERDQDGLESRYINDFIGRGVFVTKDFCQGDFLLEYHGNLLNADNARNAEDTDFMFHFNYKGEQKCIDATKEPVSGPMLGRLVNHADKASQRNCTMKTISVSGKPHLCLFSNRNIRTGEELRYDYGVKDLPWYKKTATAPKKKRVLNISLDSLTFCGLLKNKNAENKETTTAKHIDLINHHDSEYGDVKNKIGHTNDNIGIDDEEIQPHKGNNNMEKNDHETPPLKGNNASDVTKRTDHQDDVDINYKDNPRFKGINALVEIERSNHQDDMNDFEIITSKGNNVSYVSERTDYQDNVDNNDFPPLKRKNASPVMERTYDNDDVDMNDYENPPSQGNNSSDNIEKAYIQDDDDDDMTNTQSPQPKISNNTSDENDNTDVQSNVQFNEPGFPSSKIKNAPHASYEDGSVFCDDIHYQQNVEGLPNRNCRQILGNIVYNHGKRKVPQFRSNDDSDSDDSNDQESGISITEKQNEIFLQTTNIGNDKSHRNENASNVDSRFQESCNYVDNDVRYRRFQLDEDNSVYDESDDDDDDDDVRDPDYDPRKDQRKEKLDSSDNDDDEYNDDSDDDGADADEYIEEKNKVDDEYVSDTSDCSEVIPFPMLCSEQKEKEYKGERKETQMEINKVEVPGAKAYRDGRRVVDKYHSCFFCGKLQLRISRHIQTVHKNEPIVADIMSKTQEKAKGLDKLRLDGDYKHNIKVLNENKGFLILARRPGLNDKNKYSFSDFLPCEHCKGFFLKKELWRHSQTCQFACSTDESKKYSRVQSTSVLLLESSLENKKKIEQRIFGKCS